MTDIESNFQEYEKKDYLPVHRTYILFEKKTNLHIWPKSASP